MRELGVKDAVCLVLKILSLLKTRINSEALKILNFGYGEKITN
jgi:hypothetical protein